MFLLHVTKEIKLKLSLGLTKHHAVKPYSGSGGIAPRILDLGTRWRRVVRYFIYLILNEVTFWNRLNALNQQFS
jgi:hypothetical protein